MNLIFIHGAGNTGLVWHYQTECFTDAQAIDLPGHPHGKLCTSIDQYSEWLHQYIYRQGYSKPVIAGHSMGGAIAQTYALTYPQDVKALILIDTGARLRVRQDFLEQLGTGIDSPSDWLENIVEPAYSHVDPKIRKQVIDGVISVGPAMALNDFRCCDKFDVMDKVSQITLPTLVICGSDDDMTPVKYAQYLANKISGSKLLIVEGGTHHCFLEKPKEVNNAVQDFLNGL